MELMGACMEKSEHISKETTFFLPFCVTKQLMDDMKRPTNSDQYLLSADQWWQGNRSEAIGLRN